MLSRDRISRWVAIVSGLFVFVGFTAMAHAGCPNGCTATATEPLIEPPLDCLALRTYAGTCDCESDFVVENNCDTDVEAVGFTFLVCAPDASSAGETLVENGSTIDPGYLCRKPEKLTAVGKIAYEYHFIKDGIDYKLTYESDVTSFDDSGCACVLARRPSRSHVAVGLALALLAVTRRRKCPGARCPPVARV